MALGGAAVASLGALGLAWGAAHLWGWRRGGSVDRLLLSLLDVLVLVLGAVALSSPPLFERWMQEDAWVEWSTFFAYVMAGLGCARLALGRDGGRARWTRLGWLLLGGFCWAVAGEEISWGQRLFAFKPPDLFLEKNFQQELNLHNLLKNKSLAGLKLDSRYLVALIAASFGLLAPALVALLGGRLARAKALFGELFPPLLLGPYFGAVVYLCLDYPVHLVGEAAELLLGALFLAHAARVSGAFGGASAAAPVAEGSPRRVLAAVLFPVALGVGVPPLSSWLLGADASRVDETRAELELLAGDLSGEAGRAVGAKRLHKRLFTAMREGALALEVPSAFLEGRRSPAEAVRLGLAEGAPEVRADRRGYFLDPWNNPYWVRARGDGRVVLYSFGPNRRRDSDFEEGDLAAQGDDLAAEVRFR